MCVCVCVCVLEGRGGIVILSLLLAMSLLDKFFNLSFVSLFAIGSKEFMSLALKNL